MISKETTIEDLVTLLPESVSYMMEKGIRLLICGEPIWGTIEEVVLAKNYSQEDLDKIITELNDLLKNKKEAKVQ
jgi:predicted nucleotidyltransferase